MCQVSLHIDSTRLYIYVICTKRFITKTRLHVCAWIVTSSPMKQMKGRLGGNMAPAHWGLKIDGLLVPPDKACSLLTGHLSTG